MNPIVGWALAAAAVVVGWLGWGVPGVVLAITVITFWLLLQFSRALRVMRMAAGRPVGRVDSAVMLQARLAKGMTMMQVIPLTRSLGERVGDDDTWRWSDAGESAVTLRFQKGRLESWDFVRPGAPVSNHAPAGDGPEKALNAPSNASGDPTPGT